MRDRHYTNSLAGDGTIYSDITLVAASHTSNASTTAIDITIPVPSPVTVPAYFSADQGSLSPVLEVLCVDLLYPTEVMPAAVDSVSLGVDDGAGTSYYSTETASFTGVEAAAEITSLSVQRVTAGGYTAIGDTDAAGNYGTVMAQISLPSQPSKVLPTNTELAFTLPRVLADDTNYAFTSASGPLQCYIAAGYTDPESDPSMSIRDRYYAGDFAADTTSFMYSAMSSDVTAASVENPGDSSETLITVTLSSDWAIPAFLDNTQTDGGVTLTPVIELLCVEMRYPGDTITATSASDITMSTSTLDILNVPTASFSGVTTAEPATKRLAAGGYVLYGDVDTDDEVGSLLMQTSLPTRPGLSLPAGTEFKYSVPTGLTAKYTRMFTIAPGGSQCALWTTYTDNTKPITSFELRDRYYRSLNGTGVLTGDDVFYSDISLSTSVTTKTFGSKVYVTVTLDSDWTVPAFLTNAQTADGVTLTPVVEISCHNLFFPDVVKSAVTDLEMSVGTDTVKYAETAAATFSAVEVMPTNSAPALHSVVASGIAVNADTDADERVGTLYMQVDTPLHQGKQLLENTTVTFTVPTVEITTGVSAFTPASGDLQCYVGFAISDPASPGTGDDMRSRYYSGEFKGDSSTYSQMHPMSSLSSLTITGSTVTFNLFLDDDLTVDTFITVPSGQVMVLEVLCVDLLYPYAAMPSDAGLSASISDPSNTLLTTTSDLTFSSVSAGEPIVKRVVATGEPIYGDKDAEGNYGTLLFQVDLPAYPTTDLASGTNFQFSVSTGTVAGSNAFMPVSGLMSCYLRGAFANPAKAASTAMRDQYYRSLNGTGTLAGDGAYFTDMTTDVSASAVINSSDSSLLDITVTTTAAWTAEAFLANPYIDTDSSPLYPIIEILCVELLYPETVLPAVPGLPVSVASATATHFTGTAATFSGVAADPVDMSLVVKRVTAGGLAVYGDADADGYHGTLYTQVDLPQSPGKTLSAGTVFRFAAPAVSVGGGNFAFTPVSAPHLRPPQVLLH
jgi:hypothetical protein